MKDFLYGMLYTIAMLGLLLSMFCVPFDRTDVFVWSFPIGIACCGIAELFFNT